MAASWRKFYVFGSQHVQRIWCRRVSSHYVSYEPKLWRSKKFPILAACGCVGGGAALWFAYKKTRYSPAMSVPKESGVGQKAAVMQTQRELRFLSFASVEYEGNVYTTPQDFLESVTEEVPRRNDEIQLGSHLLKRAIYPGLVKTAFIALTKMTFTNRKSVDYNIPGVKTFTAKLTLFREV